MSERTELRQGTVPTPRGSILIEWQQSDAFTLTLKIPSKIQLELPIIGDSTKVLINGSVIEAERVDDHWVLNPMFDG